jgi:hypothetical protein
VHHKETFGVVALEFGRDNLQDTVGVTHIGEEGVLLETENEFAYEDIAHLGLFTIGNGGNESVKKTVFGFFEIVFVASREKNGASHCYESKR